MKRFIFAALLGVCVMVFGSGCSWNQFTAKSSQTQNTSYVMKAGVHVETRNGFVEVIGDSSLADVQVEAELQCGGSTQEEADSRLKASHVEIGRTTSGELRVAAVFPEPVMGNDGMSVKIGLPGADGVTAQTSNGHIQVENVTGKLELGSSNGSVTVKNHWGDVHIKTSNGHIELASVTGAAKAETSNGRIIVSDFAGPLDAHSSNGRIELQLRDGASDPFKLQSSNGSASISVEPTFSGAVKMDTSNGHVTLNDAGGRCTSKDAPDKSSLNIQVGQSGGTSTIDSSNGAIDFTIRTMQDAVKQ